MRISKISLISLAGIILTGCAGTGGHLDNLYDKDYYTGSRPAVESIKATQADAQIYKKTAFYLSDFKADGKAKGFFDYDFSKEDAPCTVLGEAYEESAIRKEEFYGIQGPASGKNFQFQCRPNGKTVSASEFRLYLIGSYHDCQERRWDWSLSTIPVYRDNAKNCATGINTKRNVALEQEYKKDFFRKI